MVLCHAPAEDERAEEIKAQCSNANIYKSATIEELYPIVRKAKLLITPDTSIVHLASAFNTPIICLYDGNDAMFTKFRPLSEYQKILRVGKGLTIKAIGVNDVIEAVAATLEEL